MCDFPENQSYLGIGCQKAIHTVQGDPTQLKGTGNGINAVVVQRLLKYKLINNTDQFCS